MSEYWHKPNKPNNIFYGQNARIISSPKSCHRHKHETSYFDKNTEAAVYASRSYKDYDKLLFLYWQIAVDIFTDSAGNAHKGIQQDVHWKQ